MNLAQLRVQLMTNPSRELLIELLNSGTVSNPVLKVMAFTGIQTMSDKDIRRMSNLAAGAIVYMEKKDPEGLSEYLGKVGVPPQLAMMIRNYASNIPGD
jgi:hypothetical protein